MVAQNSGLSPASKVNPCPHCGKTDWCYFLGDEISVCKRDAEAANGWKITTKTDSEGNFLYTRLLADKKTFEIGQKTIWEYPDRDGNLFVRVCRLNESETKKKYWQEHYSNGTWVKGLKKIDRKDIPIYRYSEIRQAIKEGETIFIVEGEKCADALWDIGLPATTNIGGSGKWRDSDTADLVGADCIIICPDRDVPGVKHAKQLLTEIRAENKSIFLPYPDSTLWREDRLPKSQGVDIADWIKDFKLQSADIIDYLKKPSKIELFDEKTSQEEETEEETKRIEKHYTQKAIEAIFKGKWISNNGLLYKWNGTHYEQQDEGEIKREIAAWLNEYTEVVKGGYLKHCRATTRSITDVFSWAQNIFSVGKKDINPPGLNCANGTLKIYWEGDTPRWELHPHDPSIFYTYCSKVKYDPKANSSEYDRLIKCLPQSSRQIFLRTIASALDLPGIRRVRGRMVKLCLLHGNGANGKDALRQVVEQIFCNGITEATLSDFHSYDQGRKFPLSKLEGAVINWASENTPFMSLDNVQSIKALVSGESLWIERKGKNEYAIPSNAIGLFNCNELPGIKASNEAFKSRWAIIEFPYTFKKGASKPNEIEADPRFKYDIKFIQEEVCPAFLNALLTQLPLVAKEGIDYEPTEEAIQKAREQSEHLWEFIKTENLKEDANGKIYIKDLWEKLENWYLAKDILQVDGSRKNWSKLDSKYDEPIRSSNQVKARFLSLFPDLEYGTETEDRQNRGRCYLKGLVFASEPVVEAVSRQCEAVRGSCRGNESLHRAECEAVEAKSSKFISEEKNPVAEVEHSEEHIEGMTENVRTALSENNWELLEAIMDVDDNLKKAVWEKLTEDEREQTRNLKKAASQSAEHPEPTPIEPEVPKAGQIDDRVYEKRTMSGPCGTITHVYDGRQAGKVMVEWEVPKGEEKKSTVVKADSLRLFHRKPRFEKNPPEGKCPPGPIHKFTNYQPGQTIVSQGRQIGRILKGRSNGLVILDFASKEEKILTYSDIDLMQYQRVWVLADDWQEGLIIKDIKTPNGEYFALLTNLVRWECKIYTDRNHLKVSFIAKEPKIYTYPSAQEWMISCVNSFIKNEKNFL